MLFKGLSSELLLHERVLVPITHKDQVLTLARPEQNGSIDQAESDAHNAPVDS